MSIARPLAFFAASLTVFAACSSKSGFGEGPPPPADNDGGDDGGGGLIADDDSGFGGDGGSGGITGDPQTCAEAAQAKSYVGCDYWPTVTGNLVQNVFDFAVAVANVGKQPANVTVTGPNSVNQQITVQPGTLGKIYLPWVTALKGPEQKQSAPNAGNLEASLVAQKSAYHLVSDRPVVVYQFNPLEFKAGGGPAGKNWSACEIPRDFFGQPVAQECYSYSNDASLLLPSTAMTGAYRLMGTGGFTRSGQDILPPFFAVTATQNGTQVTVKLGGKGAVVAGTGVSTVAAGGTLTLSLDAGDVAEIVGGKGKNADFSGSLLIANKPVQVIAGVACVDMPLGTQACDHVEETLFPAETLGKHYVVIPPTGPKQNAVGHVVRLYGNVDGTTLTYTPSKPASCPATLDAGQVAECGEVSADFEITGDKEFGVATFQVGGQKADPSPSLLGQPEGDPSQSFPVAVEQFRSRYVFLAPADYTTSYVDIVAGAGTTLDLDGKDVSSSLAAINGTQYMKARIKLDAGKDGAHSLTSSKPIGIQVMGYGANTSYQYPGGLNLGQIAKVPPK